MKLLTSLLKRKNIKKISALLILAALILSTACGKAGTAKPVIDEPEPIPEPVYADLSLRFFGDLMTHDAQIKAAKKSDGSYDFSDYFKYTGKYAAEADYAVINLETTLPCTGVYSGYPAFRAPEILADNIKDAGIDMCFTSNNHMNDSGLKGARTTLDVLHNVGLETAGSRKDPDSEPRTKIVDISFTDESGEVNSVKVGFVAYTYETGIINNHRCINGIQLNDEQLACYNSYLSYNGDELLNQSLEEIKSEIEYSQANADITIVYMHWGEEYQLSANAQQKYVSKYLAALRPDAVVGSHSHTVQPITEIDGVPVFYSLGNYISNQRQETLSGFHVNAHYTEQFIIGCLDFRLVKEFDETGYPKDWKVVSVKPSAIPGWIDKYTAGGQVHYAAIPLVNGFEETEELKTSGHTTRAQNALSDIRKIVGEQYLRLDK